VTNKAPVLQLLLLLLCAVAVRVMTLCMYHAAIMPPALSTRGRGGHQYGEPRSVYSQHLPCISRQRGEVLFMGAAGSWNNLLSKADTIWQG
jgi:hypothetical protein